jgi:hypothetical protein
MWFELTVSYTRFLFDIPMAASQTAFFYWRNFAKKPNLKLQKLEMKLFYRVLVARSGEGKNSRKCQVFIFCC